MPSSSEWLRATEPLAGAKIPVLLGFELHLRAFSFSTWKGSFSATFSKLPGRPGRTARPKRSRLPDPERPSRAPSRPSSPEARHTLPV